MTRLTSLVLAYSQSTSGTIPASFARLSQLTTLRLQCSGLGGKVPALDVFQRVPDYAQQCEIDEVDRDCRPYGGQMNRFSCPLPAGAEGHCGGACS